MFVNKSKMLKGVNCSNFSKNGSNNLYTNKDIICKNIIYLYKYHI